MAPLSTFPVVQTEHTVKPIAENSAPLDSTKGPEPSKEKGEIAAEAAVEKD